MKCSLCSYSLFSHCFFLTFSTQWVILLLLLVCCQGQRPVLNVLSFGAVGDGVTDDTIAFQKCLNTSKAESADCYAPSGKYNITNVLTVDSVALFGDGNGEDGGNATIILECNDSYQALMLVGDGPSVYNLKKISFSTARGASDASVAVLAYFATNFVVRNISILGGKSAGILMHNSSYGIVENNFVRHTLADAIHNTHCTTNMVIRYNYVDFAGDDGVAVVSYISDGCLVQNVTAYNNTILNQMWGRGMSVVGGQYVTYFYNYIQNSSHAAIYIASETSFVTYNPHHVYVQYNTIVNGGGLSHAAIMLTAENNDGSYADYIYVLNNIVNSPVLQGIRSEGEYLHSSNIIGNSILNTYANPAFFVNFVGSNNVTLAQNYIENVTNSYAVTALPQSAVRLFIDRNEFYSMGPDGGNTMIVIEIGSNCSLLQVTNNVLSQSSSSNLTGYFMYTTASHLLFIDDNNSPWVLKVPANNFPYTSLVATNFSVNATDGYVAMAYSEFYLHVQNVVADQVELAGVSNAVNGVVFIDNFGTTVTFILNDGSKFGTFTYSVNGAYNVDSATVTVYA